jgi:hypothetical protein
MIKICRWDNIKIFDDEKLDKLKTYSKLNKRVKEIASKSINYHKQ